jgi:sugar phosphate isomerase/epimerase
LRAGHRIKLGLEFTASPEPRKDRAFQFIHTFEALATLVGMIRSANVGAVVDLLQLHAGGGSFDEARKLGGEKIVSVVVADAPADKPGADCDETDRLLPGENSAIDLAAALVSLAEIGYEGPITPSASKSSTAGMKREQIVKLAGERLTQGWNTAGLSPAGKLSAVAKK